MCGRTLADGVDYGFLLNTAVGTSLSLID